MVPISLLPNGNDAQHLRHVIGEGRYDAVEPRRRPRPAPERPQQPTQPRAYAPRQAQPSWFDNDRPRGVAEQQRAHVRPEPPPRSRQDRIDEPPPPRRPTGRERERKPRWWTRLAEWMRGSV
ncbi:hypothetical protein FHU38_000505 [Saccharomonospora amisosensis]|uniref:Uncharacterized protein n=1 Tax=Saccharomonospora amisosensis TaxID=1128677 RepID=A0A7X5ULE7_9PSEU|nr:hypothetical protein [Saccharomonospora amisosensis]NIJ10161.1 hypothetical protein [Saccharomonospora amisosensis]